VARHFSKDESVSKGGNTPNPVSQSMKKTYENNIFIKNIPASIDENKAREVFEEKPGDIMSLRLKKIYRYGSSQTEDNVVSKNAFILYKDNQSAQRCIQLYDNQMAFGYGPGFKPLRVDFWKSKDEIMQEKVEQKEQTVQTFLQHIV
jgi:hypothetical protein